LARGFGASRTPRIEAGEAALPEGFRKRVVDLAAERSDVRAMAFEARRWHWMRGW